MSVDTELALAAARARELGDQIPEAHRPDLAALFAELLDELDRCRSDGGRVLAILDFRERMEAKLATALAHAPLPERTTTP